MREIFAQFEEYCKTPGVDSNKAKAYSKAMEYLCDYLKIDEIDIKAIDKIKSSEAAISDKESDFYKDLLVFLTNRGQKSFLENGFIKAALKYFFRFKEQRSKMKEKFR